MKSGEIICLGYLTNVCFATNIFATNYTNQHECFRPQITRIDTDVLSTVNIKLQTVTASSSLPLLQMLLQYLSVQGLRSS